MKNILKQIFPLLTICMVFANAFGETATISVDASDILHQRPTSLIGGNIEDLNFQLYGGLYSQLLHGECFEEHVDPTDLFNLKGSERFAVWILPDANGQPTLKHFGGRGRVYNDDGTVSMEPALGSIFTRKSNSNKPVRVGMLTFKDSVVFPKDLPDELNDKLIKLATGDRQVSRHWRPLKTESAKARFTLVRDGVFTGLQAQEIQFVSGNGEVGIDNAGLFRNGIHLIGGKPYEGVLRIKSEKPQTVHVSLRDREGKLLDEQILKLKGRKSTYQKLAFNLVPKTTCRKGRLAITLQRPGRITVDYAFLHAGEWGRYHGLPVRKEMAEAMLSMGVQTIRYNGSMVNRNPTGPTAYRWKKMIEPLDEREPYHGWFNPYASHGFTLFEFMDFAEVAGLTCMFGIHTAETPEDMAAFVEYCLGDESSEWGKRRIANGHPEPYHLQCIQIGNEEKADTAYIQRFKELATAIWSMDPSIEVAASNNRLKEATEEYIDLAQWLVSIGQQDRFILDSHYRSDPDSADTTLEHYSGLMFHHAMKAAVPQFNLRLWPMEENGAVCNWSRGLAHAHNLNTLQRMPLCLERSGTANVFQADNLWLIWDQGRIHFTPTEIVYQPSYYVDRMFADEWLPMVLNSKSSNLLLDVIAKKSMDEKVLTLYVTNLNNQAIETYLKLKGFNPVWTSVLQISSPDLETQNTVDYPDTIKPEIVDWDYSKDNSRIQIPPYSFTSIRFSR